MSGVLRSGVRQSQQIRSQGAPLGRRYMADDSKVNAWEAPTQIAKWKEEHIVFAVLGSWGIGIYTAMKVFGGKDKKEEAKAST